MTNSILSYSVPAIVRPALYILLALSTVSVLSAIAPVSYIVAYQYYIPYASHSVPVHLDYSERFGSYAVLASDEIELNTGIDYKMLVKLTLPSTSHNAKLGNFMIRTTVVGDHHLVDDLVAQAATIHRRRWPLTTNYVNSLDRIERRKMSSTRLAIITPKSPITQALDALVYYPFYLFGLHSENESDVAKMSRIMFDKWPGDEFSDQSVLLVELDRVVNVLDAHLEFQVKWTGLRYLMQHYKLTMFVLGSVLFGTVECIAAAVVALVVVRVFGKPDIVKTVYLPNNKQNDNNDKPKPEGEWATSFKKRMTERPEIVDPRNYLHTVQEPTPAPETDESESELDNLISESDRISQVSDDASETTSDDGIMSHRAGLATTAPTSIPSSEFKNDNDITPTVSRSSSEYESAED